MSDIDTKPADSLKSETAKELTQNVAKAQSDYIAAGKAYQKAAERLSKIQAEDDKSPDGIKTITAAAAVLGKAEESLSLKLATFSEAVDRRTEYLRQALESLDERIRQDGESKELKTERTLVMAALGDITETHNQLSKIMQDGGRTKNNPKPVKKTALNNRAVITEEIVAVLAEAEKVKTTKIENEVKKPAAAKAAAKPAAAANVELKGRYRLKAKYTETVVEALKKQLGYTNVNQVPRLEKILINMGLGDVKDDAKKFNAAVEELKVITGQKPIVTKAKKSIANFKLREGMNIGAKVTLRGNRMYEFLDKLISVALPRVRDFKGLNPSSFDGRGNYAMGVKEQLIFPEIKYDQVDKVRGFDIVIVTTAQNDGDAKAMLTALGMPFKA